MIERVDILDYISQYCDLEKRRDGEYWGLSPLKEENTPSFSVNVEKQRYYDFASGNGGNVLDFICKYHACDFYKGLQKLKDFAHISDDEVPITKRLAATSIAKKFQNKQPQRKQSSGIILSSDYMNNYVWDENKLSIWEREGISKEAMQYFQVRYDSFADRIVYPVRNIKGNIINVCGRTLDPNFKEKGIRKYTYYKKFGALDTIYGLFENIDRIRSSGEIILFEGAKSVMTAFSWGIYNTGAILTSHLNESQFQILIQLGVRIVFALDAEVDICKDKNIKKLLPYATVEWVKNKNGLLCEKDSPVDKGYDTFMKLYQERVRFK